jgi:hypothetical protein
MSQDFREQALILGQLKSDTSLLFKQASKTTFFGSLIRVDPQIRLSL